MGEFSPDAEDLGQGEFRSFTPGITVQSATYGDMSGAGGNPSDWGCQGGTVDATAEVAADCDGDESCSYAFDAVTLGDPDWGCVKDMRVQWTCDGNPEVQEMTVSGSPAASDGIIELACPPPPQTVVYATSTTSRVAVANSLAYQNLNISTTDLANSDQATFASLTGTNTSAAITSGVQEGPWVDWGASVSAGEHTIINLDTSVNTQGYDITSLYLAFGTKVAGDLRNYDVYVSSVGDSEFALVTSVVDVGQPTHSWNSANWGDDTITAITEAVIAENVDAIKIVWHQAGSFPVYKAWEVDVFGAPSDPAPQTVVYATSTTSRVAVANSLAYQNLNISTTDLANSDQATFASLTGTNTSAAITSGVQEGPWVDWGASVSAGEHTIINLDTSVNTQGYDITSLYLAFGTKVAGDLRNYDVYVSSVDDSEFALVTSVVDVGLPTHSWNSANWGDDTITPITEAVIAENVDAIKIEWHQAGSFPVYKAWEVDVFGSPSMSSEPIDTFDMGEQSASTSSGTTLYDLYSGPGPIGGDRQLRVRDGHSGTLGGTVSSEVLTAGSVFNAWGSTAPEQQLRYGSAIDEAGPFSGSPHTGTPLNLAIASNDDLVIDVAANNADTPIVVTFHSDAGNITHMFSPAPAGINEVQVSTIPGMTPAHLADIDGLTFSFWSGGNNAAEGLSLASIHLDHGG